LNPSSNTEKNELAQSAPKPTFIWFYLIFFSLVIGNFLFIILTHSLGQMPKPLADHAFFTSKGFYLNFIGNLTLTFFLVLALFQMKQSAMFWSLALLAFDACSTSYWILTQNWLETAGDFSLAPIFIVWSGCLTCFLYLRYLNKKGMLISSSGAL